MRIRRLTEVRHDQRLKRFPDLRGRAVEIQRFSGHQTPKDQDFCTDLNTNLYQIMARLSYAIR